MAKYFLPGIGGQTELSSDRNAYQSSPLLNTYSPRLFGAPPQLTNYNDMRIISTNPLSDKIGPVGDYYLQKVLQDAQVANFVVGRALFTGGTSSIAGFIRTVSQYAYALTHYDIFDTNGEQREVQSTANAIMREANIDTYNKAIADDDGVIAMKSAKELGLTGVDEDTSVLDTSNMGNAVSLLEKLAGAFDSANQVGYSLLAPLLTSLSVQQPFYTFESDWNSYINNVKMMINTAVIDLGLQNACVRIGDDYYPIGTKVEVTKNNDVWSNYRYITTGKDLGTVTAIDKQTGDTSQYVSFMVEPTGVSESFSNTSGPSQIYANVIDKGGSIGSEIAFITNSSRNAIDDAVVTLAGGAINVAESVLSGLTGGVGRFTAAIAGSMARSFVGDHTIYPEVYTGSEATTSMQMKVKLRSNGAPFSFLTNIWVPTSHILSMACPKLSKNNASAYNFPPLIQCNIPGMWGTRLGLIERVEISKNPEGKNVSVNGYPTAVDITITVKDLQHVITTSPMDNVATFLNNNTMFDYIAQCCGVDKYRVNGSMRLVSKLALASSFGRNMFYNVSNDIMTDFTSFANRRIGTFRL